MHANDGHEESQRTNHRQTATKDVDKIHDYGAQPAVDRSALYITAYSNPGVLVHCAHLAAPSIGEAGRINSTSPDCRNDTRLPVRTIAHRRSRANALLPNRAYPRHIASDAQPPGRSAFMRDRKP
jgi:hypothetical protein